ncbi:MAG: hypothetical protein U0I29_05050 [Collinsella sp.]|nr:hypothetical protein [Collinsella sp.]
MPGLAATIPDDAENNDDDAVDEACADRSQRTIARCGKLAGRYS